LAAELFKGGGSVKGEQKDIIQCVGKNIFPGKRAIIMKKTEKGSRTLDVQHFSKNPKMW